MSPGRLEDINSVYPPKFDPRDASDENLYMAAMRSLLVQGAEATRFEPHTVANCEFDAGKMAEMAKNLRLAALCLKRIERQARKAGRLR